MGFMSETKIIAGSSSYNLAGDPKSRGNFLKNTILSAVVSGQSTQNGMGKTIVDAHINGPALKYRRFFRWAEESGYNAQVGNYHGVVFSQSELSNAGFGFIAPLAPDMQKRVVAYSVGPYNINTIAVALISQYRPDRNGLNFNVEQEMHWIDNPAGYFPRRLYVPTGRLIVQWPSIPEVAYFESGVDTSNPGLFAYVIYEKRKAPYETSEDSGVVEVATEAGLPAVPGTPGAKVTTPVVLNREKTTVTTVSRPDQPDVVTTVTDPVVLNHTNWTRTSGWYQEIAGTTTDPQRTVLGSQVDVCSYREDVVITETTTTEEIEDPEDPEETITVTTKVVVTEPVLETFYTYHREVESKLIDPWLPAVHVYYQQGTNAYGDSVMFPPPATTRLFFPVVPLRRFNVSVKSDTYPGQYSWNRRAMYKAFGSKKQYNDILESLESSGSIDDVDHAWVVFGVSLGAKSDDGMAYLYQFFKGIIDATPFTGKIRRGADLTAAWVEFNEKVNGYWNEGQREYDSDGNPTNNLIVPPQAEQYTFGVNATRGQINWEYNVTISAKGGEKITGTGMNARARGKVGRCWVYNKGNVFIFTPNYHSGGGGDGETSYYTFDPSVTAEIAFGRQLTATVWEEYSLFDLMHTNNVYRGKSVTTLAAKALANPNEDTGFIIPLHEEAMREANLIDRTQLSLECAHLVLNYYEKQKIPWYASGFFKIILVIVIIVVSVVVPPVSGVSSGILGMNAAVGVSLGFIGTSAILAGAIANALAAALVAAVISKVSVSLFGDKLGALIGAVVSMVVVNLAANGGQFDMADAMQGLTKAENLLKLTYSGISTLSDYMTGKTTELVTETMEMQAMYKKQMEEIQQMSSELLGNSVDAQMVTAAIRYANEKPETFLARTTMTGDDIVTATIKMVEDFPATQLALPEN